MIYDTMSNDKSDSPGSSNCELFIGSKGRIDPPQETPLTESYTIVILRNISTRQSQIINRLKSRRVKNSKHLRYGLSPFSREMTSV